MPPFSPAPAFKDSSWAMPGWGGGRIFTATAAMVPGAATFEMSKRPRTNAPFTSPTSCPLT